MTDFRYNRKDLYRPFSRHWNWGKSTSARYKAEDLAIKSNVRLNSDGAKFPYTLGSGMSRGTSSRVSVTAAPAFRSQPAMPRSHSPFPRNVRRADQSLRGNRSRGKQGAPHAPIFQRGGNDDRKNSHVAATWQTFRRGPIKCICRISLGVATICSLGPLWNIKNSSVLRISPLRIFSGKVSHLHGASAVTAKRRATQLSRQAVGLCTAGVRFATACWRLSTLGRCWAASHANRKPSTRANCFFRRVAIQLRLSWVCSGNSTSQTSWAALIHQLLLSTPWKVWTINGSSH